MVCENNQHRVYNESISYCSQMTGRSTNRRQFLAALGSAGMVGIAGCSGDGGEGETPTDTATASPTPTSTPSQEAVDHYETAIEILIDNKETLDAWAESSFESDKVTSLQESVRTAREELDAAGEAADPTGDLIVQINQAKLVANFQTLSLDYYEVVNVFFQVVSEASNLGDNELHERAADTFAEARVVLDDGRQAIEDMGTVLQQIDTDALSEPELAYTGEPLDYLDLTDRKAIDGAEQYTVGYENLHLAFVQLESGLNHQEKQEFTEAREAWEEGRQRAKDSKSAFEATIENDFTPQNLREDSINRLADVETIIEAYDKFVEGATEAEAGNIETANTLLTEGFDILGQL